LLFSEVIMPARSTFKVFILCALVLSLVASVVAVQTQRRKRPSRRASVPVSPTYVPAPSPTASDDPRLVSTADDQSQTDASRTGNTRRTTSTSPDADASNRAVKQLSNELTQLNKKVDDMEKQRRTDLLQERLTRAEQRVEALQTQMTDVMEKQANLQARVEQLDELMKPENLDRQLATSGTFRPDEAREALRHQYDNEKKRVNSQLDVQNTRRQQLEKSLSDATQLADRMRSELDDALRHEAEGDTGTTTPTPRPSPRTSATPEPTPTPPM
jgi:predicted metal-dependent hydrolase